MSFIPRHYATVYVLNGHCSNVLFIVYMYVDIYRGPLGRIAYVLIVTQLCLRKVTGVYVTMYTTIY